MRLFLGCLCAIAMLLTACSHGNNLFAGEVEAMVGSHKVVVTDCYRISVPAMEKLAGIDSYRFMPCRDADVVIQSGELSVNGKSYGHLNPTDSVLVDHGIVSIASR